MQKLLLTTLLCSSVVFTACSNDTPEANKTAKTETIQQTNTAPENSANLVQNQTNTTSSSLTTSSNNSISTTRTSTASSNVTAQILGDMTKNAMIAMFRLGNQVAEANKQPAPLTEAQMSCFASAHHGEMVATLDKYLHRKFSASEMNELNTYFNSSAGRKHMGLASQVIDGALGGQGVKITEHNAPTQNEQQTIQAFTASALGQKFHQVLQQRQEIDQVMEPITLAKAKTCNIQMPQ